MKTKTILVASTIFVFLTASAFAQEIHHVNNNPGNLGDFEDLQTAHDSAVSGDTLYIAGSAQSYGTLNLSKPLFIYGPGFFLAENPETQADTLSAKLDTININADGSLITGLEITGEVSVSANNITISRNKIRNIIVSDNLSNVIIEQNYITFANPANNFLFCIEVGDNGTNILINNNFLEMPSGLSNGSLTSGTGTVLDLFNNVMLGKVTIDHGVGVIHNNILRDGSFSTAVTNVQNNLGNSGQFGTTNGNQVNVDMNTVFEGSGSTDGQWQLKAGSPAIGAGTGGFDAGMFGETATYVLSGLPNIPAVHFFEAASVASEESRLPIQIKIKSHDGLNITAIEYFFNLLNPTIGRITDFTPSTNIDVKDTLDLGILSEFGPDTLFIYGIDENGKRSLDQIHQFDFVQNSILVQAKIFLEGPYNSTTDLMSTALNDSSVIPDVSPYGFSNGPCILIPEDVVDWVLVHLRESEDGDTLVAKSAFLHKDGRIVEIDGTTDQVRLTFTGQTTTQNFFIVITHRNHLSIMSATPVPLNIFNATLYDFTAGTDKFFGTASAATELESGVFGMYAGDANGNGQVQNDDKNVEWKSQVGEAGYKDADFNMNGQVQNDDKNEYWLVNVGRGTQVPEPLGPQVLNK